MIKVNLTLKDNMSSAISQIRKDISKLPEEALKEFVKETPVKSGNARRKTKLSQDTIYANYPYASKLDDGVSKQAPQGMSEPVAKWLDKKYSQLFRK